MNSHCVGYTNRNKLSRSCVLHDQTVQCIPFRILHFIQNLSDTESLFILMGFTRCKGWGLRMVLYRCQVSFCTIGGREMLGLVVLVTDLPTHNYPIYWFSLHGCLVGIQ